MLLVASVFFRIPTHPPEWRAHVRKRWRTGIRVARVSYNVLENGKGDLLNWQDKQPSLPGLLWGSILLKRTTLEMQMGNYVPSVWVRAIIRRPNEGPRSMTLFGKFISLHVWKKISLMWTKIQMQMKVHERDRNFLLDLFFHSPLNVFFCGLNIFTKFLFVFVPFNDINILEINRVIN